SPGVCDGGGREGVVDSAGAPTSIQVERRPPPNLPRAADVAGEETLRRGPRAEFRRGASGSGLESPSTLVRAVERRHLAIRERAGAGAARALRLPVRERHQLS